MIIIRTSNGDTLINEHTVEKVTHDKQERKAYVYSIQMQLGGQLLPSEITDVVEMVFVNDAQPVEWHDRGILTEDLENLKRLEQERKANEQQNGEGDGGA